MQNHTNKKFLKNIVDKSLYHYVLVDPDKKEMFLEQSKTCSTLARKIGDYGRILYSGWGQDPPESISDRIERACFCIGDRDLEEELTNLSVKDSDALHDAARNGELGVVRYFIKRGVNINSADKNGWTSLHHAAYGGSSRVVQYLINNVANIHPEDTVCGRKPIHIAAREGNTGIMRLF
ncbi:ankyrin repeat domain-containing protein [Wolbachia endosymbiont of Tettigetta isshikii]|uniref:ankyrin repeat domain-containing protein n=1 Tax=Wolbachia endosymbiont of Tettigetta isshikii TaxID=3239093 RepID=UPI00397F1BF9